MKKIENRKYIYIIVAVAGALIWFLRPSPVVEIPAALLKSHSITYNAESLNKESLQHLINILKIPTVRKDENKVAEYLSNVLKKEGITTKLIVHPDRKDKVSLIAEIGPADSTEGIILMGHTDVVESSDDGLYPPFDPKIVDGRLYGRGTLDMKGMVVLEMMTLIELYRQKIPLKNKIMFLAVPDEESGGQYGAQYLVENFPDNFKNYKYIINEGGFGIKNFPKVGQNFFNVQFAEKGILAFSATAHGDAGHASMPTRNYSTLQLMKFINQLLVEFSDVKISEEVLPFFHELSNGFNFPNSFLLKRLANPLFKNFVANKLTERNTINAMLKNTIAVTGLKTPDGGVNVIPHSASAMFDMRLLPGFDAEEIFQKIKNMARQEKIELQKINVSNPTASTTNTVFFQTIKGVLQQIPNTNVAPYLSAGGTDNRFFREKGFICYGLIPFIISMDEIALLHGTNEYVKLENLNLGQQILMDLMIQMNL